MKMFNFAAAITSIVLFGAVQNAAEAAITDPSFEGSGGWVADNNGAFTAERYDTMSVNGLPTDGTQYGRIYSIYQSSFVAGQFGEFSQEVDLTGVSTLIFDAALDSFDGSEQNAWNTQFEATFRIGSDTEWSANTHGEFDDVTIDVSGLTGLHTIAFRNTALTDGYARASNWFMFDNLRTSANPVPLPAGLLLMLPGLVGLGLLGRRRA